MKKIQKIENKNLKPSSKDWLRRHINDKYVHMAKKMQYRSRASFKLIQIDEKFKIFSTKSSLNIIDLGCAPGGWSQIIKEKCKNSKIVGVDLLEMKKIDGVTFIKGDFCKHDIQLQIENAFQVNVDSESSISHSINNVNNDTENQKKDFMKINLILSDIAPSLSGNRQADIFKMESIAEIILEFCIKNIAKNGTVVLKYFQSGNNIIINQYKKYFKSVKLFKPDASRSESIEIYLIAQGFFAK